MATKARLPKQWRYALRDLIDAHTPESREMGVLIQEWSAKHGESCNVEDLWLLLHFRAVLILRNEPGDVVMGDKFVGDKKSYNVTAGRDATNLSLGDDNSFRDFTAYKNDVNQAGVAGDIKSALIDTRREIDEAELATLIKSSILQAYDKLTVEVAKGEAKNPSLVANLWKTIVESVKQIPNAAKILEGLSKLGGLVGLPSN